MGLRSFLLHWMNNQSELKIASPLKGMVVELKKVDDPAFASGILGAGVAIQPTEGKILSPVNGIIETLFPTNHAIAVKSKSGVEILIHIGLDTVKLEGKYFTSLVKEGKKVKKGDVLIEFDLNHILAEGYNLLTPILISNTDSYAQVTPFKYGITDELEDIILIKK